MKDKIGYGKRVVVSASDSHVGGIVHEIEKGKRTDMLFHLYDEKVVYVMSGKLKVWVIKDGQISSLVVQPGASFFVRAGLPHQFEAEETSIMVEFISNIQNYKEEKFTMVIGRGDRAEKLPEAVEEGEFALMKSEDEEKVQKKTRKRKTKKKSKRKTVTGIGEGRLN